MDLNAYQQGARRTARYPDVGSNPIYPTLGLCGEAGEVADKVKKVLRDHGGVFSPAVREGLQLELGMCSGTWPSWPANWASASRTLRPRTWPSWPAAPSAT